MNAIFFQKSNHSFLEQIMSQNNFYRKKNLNSAYELERQNRYLKVTSFSAWIVVIAAILAVIGIFLWAGIHKVNDSIQGAGNCENGVMTCYFREEDMDQLDVGTRIWVDGEECHIEDVIPQLYYAKDVPREILYLSPKSEWYQTVTFSCPLEDGTYQASADLGEISPLSFLVEGDDLK